MTYLIPPGTRDILPDEMRELRQLSWALLGAFGQFGYGEVSTPTMEYEDVLVQGDERAAGASYRTFDEAGQVLALRSDMTIPIARLAATRFTDRDAPLRFCYLSPAYRAVTPQRGQQREFLQAGVELIGVGWPEGTVEVLEVLSAALDAAKLPRARIGVGDAGFYRGLLESYGIPAEQAEPLLAALASHDLVELERLASALDVGAKQRSVLVDLPGLRGGRGVFDRAAELGGTAAADAVSQLRVVSEGLEAKGLADRVIFDLGLVRDLGYYTGAVFEVYDPALGHVLGGGGRYDELLGRFGRPLPACGFALYVERVHVAQAEEERSGQGGPR
ncbi:MAG: ATP phosphoribosyltransferase regulatory subunit [Solirubrobacterales bacterium]